MWGGDVYAGSACGSAAGDTATLWPQGPVSELNLISRGLASDPRAHGVSLSPASAYRGSELRGPAWVPEPQGSAPSVVFVLCYKFTAGRAHEFWDGCFEGTVLNTQVRKPDLLQTVSLISQKRATSVQNLR